MKKIILLCHLIIFIVSPLFGESKNITLKYEKKNTSQKGTTISRVPMFLPIEVCYDSNASYIEISSQQTLEAEVYLYDMQNNLIDYSPILDTTFFLPVSYNGPLYIYIENEDWYAIGEFEINE